MICNIDKIYELFIWDSKYSDEEYENRVQKGLKLAKNIKYLFPFLRPILPNKKSISVWQPCARALAERTDEELEPYIYLLLQWIQDLNWPGAEIILERLGKMSVELISESLEFSKRQAQRDNDELWLLALAELEKLQSNTA